MDFLYELVVTFNLYILQQEAPQFIYILYQK